MVPVIAQATQIHMAPRAAWPLGISMEVAVQTLGIHRVLCGIGSTDTPQLSGLGSVMDPDMELDPWLEHFLWLQVATSAAQISTALRVALSADANMFQGDCSDWHDSHDPW